MSTQHMILALSETGDFLERYCKGELNHDLPQTEILNRAVQQSYGSNPWFIREFVMTALSSVASLMHQQVLEKWLSGYPQLLAQRQVRRVGVISAGNIPLVGFHDFLCVLLSGHHYIGKLSAQDHILLPVLAGFITRLYPEAAEKIHFTGDKLSDFDAVIATGSNNTHRYFEYYFRDYPKILRKNRNSIAILTGNESKEQLEKLGDDLFLYFGLGCRNVSKIFVPQGYDITGLFPHLTKYAFLEDHFKYHNNYSYYKSIYLVNREPHFDNGYILLKPEINQISSPVSVVYYEEYQDINNLMPTLEQMREQIQCMVGNYKGIPQMTDFGKAQFPGPEEYADGVDTLNFLLGL